MPPELSFSPPVSTRHEIRRNETRDRLLAAARKLFVEGGYHGTRPQDIARSADLAAGTFYTYFTDKREIFLVFVAQAGDELMQRIASQSTPGNFNARLKMSLDALLEYDDENPGVLGAAFTDPATIDRAAEPIQGMREGLASSLVLAIERGISEGHLRSDFDSNLIAHAIVGMIHQALVYGSSTEMNRGALVDQITHFCELALMSPCGKYEIDKDLS